VTGAAYLNFTEGEEKVRRGASAFSPENLRRMQKLKAWVDPDDRFAHGFHLETD
jgi:FAD/FMN-containing dehydrogenase